MTFRGVKAWAFHRNPSVIGNEAGVIADDAWKPAFDPHKREILIDLVTRLLAKAEADMTDRDFEHTHDDKFYRVKLLQSVRDSPENCWYAAVEIKGNGVNLAFKSANFGLLYQLIPGRPGSLDRVYKAAKKLV